MGRLKTDIKVGELEHYLLKYRFCSNQQMKYRIAPNRAFMHRKGQCLNFGGEIVQLKTMVEKSRSLGAPRGV